MLDHHPASTVADTNGPFGLSSLRVVEAQVLLAAITALRLGGVLTEAEYLAKYQRLTARP